MPEVTANLDAAFEVANKWREASGQEILSAWIPSVPKKMSECLLARAFNKNCAVYYHCEYPCDSGVGTSHEHYDASVRMKSGSGYVRFNTADDAKRFSEVTEFEPHHASDLSVRLPDEIALVAYEFDFGSFREHAVEPPE